MGARGAAVVAMRAALVATALAMVALASGAAWLLSTPEGLRWAADRAAAASEGRLALESPAGSLGRGVHFERIELSQAALTVEARDVSARLALLSLLTGTLRIEDLHVGTLRVSRAGPESAAPPRSVGLPLPVRVYGASVARLRIELPEAVHEASEVRFSYAGGPTRHVLRDASAQTSWGPVAFSGAMDAAAPFRTEGKGSLEYRGARLSATAWLLPFSSPRIEHLEASIEGADLARFREGLPRTALKGLLRGAGTADALLSGTLSMTNAAPGPLDRGQLPASSLEARVALRGRSLFLSELRALVAGGQARGSGVASLEGVQLELRLAGIDLRALRSSLRRTRLAGGLTLEAAEARQRARGRLSQDGMALTFDASRAGQRVEVRAFRAEAGGGVATGTGRIDLGGPLAGHAQAEFSGFNPSRFGDYPEGSLNGRAELEGRAGKDPRVHVRWTIAQSRLDGQPLASRGSATLARARVLQLDAHAAWGGYQLDARGAFGAPGDQVDWTLAAERPPIEALGSVKARGALRGSLEAHELSVSAAAKGFQLAATARGGWRGEAGWRGELARLRIDGQYPLVLQQATSLQVAPNRVKAGELRARLGDGDLRVRALEWTPGFLATAGEFRGLPAAWLVQAAGAGERVRSSVFLDGQWNLESTPELNGRVEVRRARGDVSVVGPPSLALGLGEATLYARFDGGAVSMAMNAASRLGTLQAKGTAASLSRDAAIDFEARVALEDIRALAGALPAHVRIGGRASAVLLARGTLGAPELAGTVTGEAMNLHYPPYGIYLEDGTLKGRLEGKGLRIEAFNLRGGQGSFSAAGYLALGGEEPATLRWQARGLQALSRPDMRLAVSGEGTAALRERRVALKGRLRVDQGYFEQALRRLPRLDGDIVIVGEEKDVPPSRSRPPVDLDVNVDLGNHLVVRTGGFDGRLKGELQVLTGEAGALLAYGRVIAVDATYRAYGRNLQVDTGMLVFNGPVSNPALQIDAWRRNQEVHAGVRITGQLSEPQVELVSEPPLPEGAKLSWLVLGRAPTDTSGADLAVLQTAATALLGRGDRVPITTRIADAVGLDELALRGSSELANRVVAFGKRLSERIYITYEQGIGAAAQNVVKLDLALTERISLRAQAGTSNGAGVYYRYSWD